MLHLIIMSLPVILMLTTLIAAALDNRQNKPLKATDVEVCDLRHKDIVLQLKCKHCKKKFKAFDRVKIEYYITYIDSICPYCNAYKSIRTDVEL